jgi:hypothetical protein
MRRRNVLSVARPAGWIFSFVHAELISASMTRRSGVGGVCAGNAEAQPQKSNTATALGFDSMMNRRVSAGGLDHLAGRRLQLYPQEDTRARAR